VANAIVNKLNLLAYLLFDDNFADYSKLHYDFEL